MFNYYWLLDDLAANLPTKRDVFVRQEQPDPLTGQVWTWAGVQITPSPPALPVSRFIIIEQEPPFHPSSFLLGSLTKSINLTPIEITNQAIIVQEQPFHPSSQFQAGLPPSNVFLPSHRTDAITRQEQPDHPSSQFSPGVPAPNVMAHGNRVVLVDRAFQEYPPHPLPILVSSFPAPTHAPPGNKTGLLNQTTQEFPFHPAPFVRHPFNAVVDAKAATKNKAIIISQEQPWHPTTHGYKWLWTHFIKTDALAATKNKPIMITREEPWHPGSFFHPGPPGTNVASPSPSSGYGFIVQ